MHLLPFENVGRENTTARFLGSVDRRLLVATSVAAIVALLLTWVAARRILAPIAELRDATRDLANGQLSRRVRLPGDDSADGFHFRRSAGFWGAKHRIPFQFAAPRQDEIAELARSFNHMAERLEQQTALRRDLVHDVAHELRTPLTALRCRVETLQDGLATDPAIALRGISQGCRPSLPSGE